MQCQLQFFLYMFKANLCSHITIFMKSKVRQVCKKAIKKRKIHAVFVFKKADIDNQTRLV